MAEDLKSIITPTLLTHIATSRIPHGKAESLDFSQIGRETFKECHFDTDIKEQAWPALVAMSKVGLDDFPDPLTFLPEPSSPEFPEQSFGLTLLLDQGARIFCKGIDARWSACYFDVIAQRLAAALRALPEEQRPDTPSRWEKDVGASLDYWLITRFWFGAVWVHSESRENQKIALAYMEETRKTVEEATGKTDPNREKRSEILSDTTTFPFLYRQGPPEGDNVTLADYAFFMCKLMDVHYPIIEKFGRYPYRNRITGRQTTDEELAWLDKVDHLGEAPAEIGEKIKEDIENGVWAPLGSGLT